MTISFKGRFADLLDAVPASLLQLADLNQQTVVPALARSPRQMAEIEQAIQHVATHHLLIRGDSRNLAAIADESVHLVVTSPPYWTLKRYPNHDGQLGHIADYEEFLDALDQVWHHVFRVLVPGGRLVVVVGDVCLSRRQFGRHVVYPLHASIQERCREIGFDNLAPIIWHKIANAKFEVENGSSFLGKPYEPNAVVKNDIEYVLFQRKAGGYRKPTLAARMMSTIPADRHKEWFQQIWTLGGASTAKHPAPYPLPVAERLVRMFSFVGDTVLDPFLGTGTTSAAAALWGRNSIGVEIDPGFFKMARSRVEGVRKHQLPLAI